MEDLINRSDAIKWFEPYADRGLKIPVETVIQNLKDIPSAEPKQGEWEWNQYDGNPAIGNYHCSICRWLVPHDKYAYCPNCGCRMKGADNERTDN